MESPRSRSWRAVWRRAVWPPSLKPAHSPCGVVYGACALATCARSQTRLLARVSSCPQFLREVPPMTTALAAATDALLGTYRRAPMELVRGAGVELFDAEGKVYLDLVSGIAVNALGYGDAGL